MLSQGCMTAKLGSDFYISQMGTCLSHPCCINNFQNGRLTSNDNSWTRLFSFAKSQINTVCSIVFDSYCPSSDRNQNCLRTAALCFEATLWNCLIGGILSTLRDAVLPVLTRSSTLKAFLVLNLVTKSLVIFQVPTK